MHYIKTFTNSFILGEIDDNGRIISELGFAKGDLTYLITNENVKFYLREDYMYSNCRWSADVPLLINGIPVGINALPTALKEIFKQEKDEIGVDVDFNPESFNAIANAPVTNRFNADEASINALSGDVETLGEQLSNKADSSAVTSIAEAKVEEYTYDKNTIDDKIANVDVSGQLVNYLTISGAQETYQPLSAMTGYATEQWVIDQHYITGVDLSDYAKIEDIPTSNSGLTNDAGYITESALDGYATEQWVGEQGYLTEHQDISGKQDVSGMTAYTTTAVTSALNDVVTGHTSDLTIHVTTSDKDTWNAKADLSDIPDVSDYFDGAEYVSSAKTIVFTHAGVTKASIDATAFVKDGMVDDVTIEDGWLIITFNTDAGKQAISIAISDIFDADNYYTKSETNDAISAATSGKADTSRVDVIEEVTSRAINDIQVELANKADSSAITAVENEVIAVSGDVATLSGKVDTNEEITSRAINDLMLGLEGKAEASAITSVASDVATLSGKVDVNEEITSRAINDLKTNKLDVSAYTPVDLSEYYTSAQTEQTISLATDDMATQTWVGQQGYITGVDLSDYATQEYVAEAVSGKADTSALTEVEARLDEIDEVAARALVELDDNKQDKLTAGSGITISNNVISCTVSGGSTYSAGRGIDITNDIISFNLPISAGTGTNSVKESYQNNKASGDYSHAEGISTNASGIYSHAEGQNTIANGTSSHAEGSSTLASGLAAHAEGYHTEAKNNGEHASGFYNVSKTGSTADNKTLFSVGNGTADDARHNAFEIRNNGDIYISSGTTDVKLQDVLSGKADSSRVDEIDEVAARAIDELQYTKLDVSAYTPVDLSEYYTSAQTDNAINSAVSGKMDTSAYTPVTVDQTLSSGSSNAIANSAVTNGFENYTVKQDSENGVVRYWSWKTPSKPYGGAGNTHINNFSINGRCPLSQQNGSNNYIDKFQLLEISAFTAYSGSVETALSGKADVSAVTAVSDRVNEIDEVAARALDELYDTKADISDVPTSTSAVTSGSTDVITSGGVYQQLGGLKLLQITQNDYDNLQVKDNSTLYVIVN